MRKISVEPEGLKLTDDLAGRLKQFLVNGHEKARNGTTGLQTTWRTALRMYQGTPADRRWLPFDNAPHIEITIGAQCSDAVYAQALDLIFQSNPPLTSRSRKEDFDTHSDAMQDLIDWGTGSKWRFKPAVKTGLLDDVQLGTGVFYIPWLNVIRNTDLGVQVVNQGPEIIALPIENFILPPDATDVQTCEFVTMRKLMTKREVMLVGKQQGWKIDDDAATGSQDSSAVMRDRRKLSGLIVDDPSKEDLVIGYTWSYFDVNDDGIAEDVQVIWNMVTGNPLKLMWNQYDCRPFVMFSYQDRAHVPWGIGVMEMTAPFEEEATEIRNNRVWNMMMRNQMMFQGPEQAMSEVEEIYNGKYIPNDGGEITVMNMGEPDNTPIQAEMISLQNAQARVGVNELQAGSRLGGRTPGITALSALQQANRRFTPAFDNMREACAGAVKQCLYRYQERVRAGDKAAIKQLKTVLGDDKAALVIELFKKKDVELHDALDIQLTAASVSVNREADRQNMVMLQTIWEKYIQSMTMFAQAKATNPFHGAAEEADQAAKVMNKLMGKILRTFDQVSDVDAYLITLDDIPNGVVMPPAMQQLMGGMQNSPQVTGAQPPQGPQAPDGQ